MCVLYIYTYVCSWSGHKFVVQIREDVHSRTIGVCDCNPMSNPKNDENVHLSDNSFKLKPTLFSNDRAVKFLFHRFCVKNWLTIFMYGYIRVLCCWTLACQVSGYIFMFPWCRIRDIGWKNMQEKYCTAILLLLVTGVTYKRIRTGTVNQNLQTCLLWLVLQLLPASTGSEVKARMASGIWKRKSKKAGPGSQVGFPKPQSHQNFVIFNRKTWKTKGFGAPLFVRN